jgi:hypothetical protein
MNKDTLLEKALAIAAEEQENDDIDLAVHVFISVRTGDREIGTLRLEDIGLESEERRLMRIHFTRSEEEGAEQEDVWAPELRAILRIMEVAEPLIVLLETKLRRAGKEAWAES